MTGWIVAAFMAGYLAGAGTIFAWGVWLSRRDYRRFGDAVRTIPGK